jgi:hypothetical protein
MDGSEDGDLGDVDRLRVGKLCFVVDFKNLGDFSLLSVDSLGRLLRGCRDNEDIRRLAAAIGPIDRHSVKELVLLSLEFVNSSLEDDSSLFDILLNK